MEELRNEYMPKFDNLTSRLSPENLCCDGEISKTEINIRYRKIMKEWKALEKQYAVKVTEDDVYKWWKEENKY